MAATFIAFILLILAGVVIWNWGFIKSFIPQLSSEGAFQLDANIQMVIIILIMFALMFFAYMVKRR